MLQLKIKRTLKNQLLIFMIGSAIGATVMSQATYARIPETRSLLRAGDAIALRIGMQKLWLEHVLWTRLYIIGRINKLENTEEVAKRLFQNQTDLGNAFTPYYGPDSSAKLTSLLMDHIKIAGQIVSFAIEQNAVSLLEAQQRWTSNADEIAKFLHESNPSHWPLSDLQKMLYEHLNLTAEELNSQLKKDWTKDIETFDQIETKILQMADALSAGIATQYNLNL